VGLWCFGCVGSFLVGVFLGGAGGGLCGWLDGVRLRFDVSLKFCGAFCGCWVDVLCGLGVVWGLFCV